MQRSRDLLWDGCLNVRDLGGLPTEDGSRTRFGIVVRADNVTLLSKRGWQALAQYGVRRIVDLRHYEEVEMDPVHPNGIEVVHTPIVEQPAAFADIDKLLGEISEPVAWRRAHYLALLDRAADNFAKAVSAVAQGPEGAVLVHCSGGVDRTGLASSRLCFFAPPLSESTRLPQTGPRAKATLRRRSGNGSNRRRTGPNGENGVSFP